jgi:putative NIF3 family GTP cyclohydrolase 1 type 2
VTAARGDGVRDAPAPVLGEVDAAIAGWVEAAAFPAGERGGVWRAGARPVRRLGLALEPWAELGPWARAHALDALFLHRPWRLAAGVLAPDVGVVTSHLPFDERLTTGWNPRLAGRLALRALAPLGARDGRPLAMLGDWAPRSRADAIAALVAEFEGAEAVLPADDQGDDAAAVARVCVAHAMTDALVRDAAARGATLYVTGQLRRPAEAAARERGVTVVAVGHARSERWGLRTLAALLCEAFPALRVELAPAPPGAPARAAVRPSPGPPPGP